VFLPYYCLDLPQHICREAERVRAAFGLWADEPSRREYLAQLRWRLHLDFDGLASPVTYRQYFPPDLFAWAADEVFVDCGAYDGDTLKDFLRLRGDRFVAVVALEPDPASFRKLSAYVETLPVSMGSRIRLVRAAAAAHPGTLRFNATGQAGAGLSPAGALDVEGLPLDEILADNPPTYIKMDIEGAEVDALLGARHCIQRHSPVLAICVYHKQQHLWQIPLLLHDLGPDYRFFLRPHNEEGWDLICYAVPASRLLARGRKV
jgi:FkbM family methyltransferase